MLATSTACWCFLHRTAVDSFSLLAWLRPLNHFGWAMCLAQTTTATTATCALAIYCACAVHLVNVFVFLSLVRTCPPLLLLPPSSSSSLFYGERLEWAIFHLCAFCTWFIFCPKFFSFVILWNLWLVFGWCLRGNIEVKTKREVKFHSPGEVVFIFKRK